MQVWPILQMMVDDVDYDRLPLSWNSFDLVRFSQRKYLWKFQQEALENAVKVLYLYFKEDHSDKRKFYERYLFNGLEDQLSRTLDIRASKVRPDVLSLLQEYYSIEDDRIRFYNFINRVAFWMATGSGKTLLIIKLVEVLKRLMELGEIPENDILILTHRDDLLNQIKRHVAEFNELAAERGFRINLVELSDYERVKRDSLTRFLNEITVFYYRSDLIGSEQKEKLVDFRNYENGGRWYIILDEAHKGDKEESKRQMFYAIMSRNGFLFNFSATFTDPRDVITTAYNFNLERFISEGYGKHIYLLNQEMRAFKEKEDFNGAEKQKIVLKALILLAYLKKLRRDILRIADRPLYHEPLLLALVNTVNLTESLVEKPDLTLFFSELERVARGDVAPNLFNEAKMELVNEFTGRPKLLYEGTPVHIDAKELMQIDLRDILNYVYNSDSFGSIEAVLIPGKAQEAVFKLKNSDKPFALIKIGNAVRWIRENLPGYDVVESYEDTSIFENLDARDDISVLMGSRAFYEGWDSVRPNVLLFINIGVGKDARKFVLQSLGRGVRVEPIPGRRRRLKETLFVFGTNRETLLTVLDTLRVEGSIGETISLSKNDAVASHTLLIPVFKPSGKMVYQGRAPQKFVVSENMFHVLREYFGALDDRILIVRHGISPELLSQIRHSFNDPKRYYKITNAAEEVSIDVMVRRLITHFSATVEELSGFKPLGDEIVHFKKIKVFLDSREELEELMNKIRSVSAFKSTETERARLKALFENGELSVDKFMAGLEKLSKLPQEAQFRELRIKYVVNHYYVPLLLSLDEKISYVRHVVRSKSEVNFINRLDDFLRASSDKIGADWWLFSKIDEHLDSIYIPYYDPESNRVRKFKPDFIFWMQRGDEYFIVFVDPKGTKHTDFEYKVDGFRQIFEDLEAPKLFEFQGLKVRVLLYLYTEDRNKLPAAYRKYWFDDVSTIFDVVSQR